LCSTAVRSAAAPHVAFYGSTMQSNTVTTPIQLMEGVQYQLPLQGKIAGLGNNTTSLQVAYTYGTLPWAFDSVTSNGTGINPIIRNNVGNNGNLTATLYWTPDSMNVGNTYSVTFTLSSPNSNTTQTRTYYFYVNDDTTNNNNNDSLCNKVITVTSTNVACNTDSTGSIDITVTGNTDSLTYSWTGPGNFLDTMQDVSNLVPGVYIVTINEDGCAPVMDTITITQSSGITGMFNVDTTFVTDSCEDGYIFWGIDTSVSVTVSGGTGPYTFNWIAGAVGTTSVGIITLDTMGNVPSVFTVVVTDSMGCFDTLTFEPCVLDISDYLCGKDSNKVMICHHAGPEKTLTLCIGLEGLLDHLAHGDMLGACDSSQNKMAENTEEPKIFPNPGNGSFTISLNEQTTTSVTVTDIQGRVIYRNTFAAGTTSMPVTIPNARTGVYFLNIQSGKSVYSTKVFVE